MTGVGGGKAKCLNSVQYTDSKCQSCMATGGLNNDACGSITYCDTVKLLQYNKNNLFLEVTQFPKKLKNKKDNNSI